MKPTIGPIIRKARQRLDLTRAEASKEVGISASYLGHLERSAPVTLSKTLSEKLIDRLGVPRKIESLRPAHNRRASAWYSAYRAKRARKAA